MATGPREASGPEIGQPADDGPSPGATTPVPPPPRRRAWLIRAIIAVVVLAAMLVAGRRFYDELHRLRTAPPLLVSAITLLWLASRYPAAHVMRISLAALGHHIGRYEACMLQKTGRAHV